MTTEHAQRIKVIMIAHSCLGTPYHPQGMLKGIGFDCGTIIAYTFEEAGVVPHIDIPYYPPDFAMHQSKPYYLDLILKYCRRVEDPQEGDIALYKFGHVGSHGAIIIDLEKRLIIHSYLTQGVILGSLDETRLKNRFIGFFSPWGKS